MFLTSKLSAVRKQHFALGCLPDAIHIPAAGNRPETPAKPIEDATLDDIAFAMRALDAEFNAAASDFYLCRMCPYCRRCWEKTP